MHPHPRSFKTKKFREMNHRTFKNNQLKKFLLQSKFYFGENIV